MNDTQLLQRFIEHRDAEAFEQLVRRHQAMVVATCGRRLADPADRDDAAQETFIKLARHARRIDRSVGAWLYRTANHTAIDLIRAQSARRRHEQTGGQLNQQHNPCPDDNTPLREQSVLDDAIAELADADQRVIVGYYFEQRTQRQLADQLGVNQSTVKRRIDAVLEALRTKLTGRGVTVSASALATTLSTAQASADVPITLTPAIVQQALAVQVLPATLSGALKMWILTHKVASIVIAAAAATGLGSATYVSIASNGTATAQAAQIPNTSNESASNESIETNTNRVFVPSSQGPDAGSTMTSASGADGYIKINNYTLTEIIALAYDLPSKHQVVVRADIPPDTYDAHITGADWRQAMTDAIGDEFGLVVENDRLPIDSYLIERKDNTPPRLQLAEENQTPDLIASSNRGVRFRKIPMLMITQHLELWTGRRVIDRSGLSDEYNLDLPWYGDSEPGVFMQAFAEATGLSVTDQPVPQPVVVVTSTNQERAAIDNPITPQGIWTGTLDGAEDDAITITWADERLRFEGTNPPRWYEARIDSINKDDARWSFAITIQDSSISLLKNASSAGIAEVNEQDRMRLALASPGSTDRPQDFSGQDGSRTYTLTRHPASALLGTWEHVTNKEGAERVFRLRFTDANNVEVTTTGGLVGTFDMRYRATEKQITLHTPDRPNIATHVVAWSITDAGQLVTQWGEDEPFTLDRVDPEAIDDLIGE